MTVDLAIPAYCFAVSFKSTQDTYCEDWWTPEPY